MQNVARTTLGWLGVVGALAGVAGMAACSDSSEANSSDAGTMVDTDASATGADGGTVGQDGSIVTGAAPTPILGTSETLDLTSDGAGMFSILDDRVMAAGATDTSARVVCTLGSGLKAIVHSAGSVYVLRSGSPGGIYKLSAATPDAGCEMLGSATPNFTTNLIAVGTSLFYYGTTDLMRFDLGTKTEASVMTTTGSGFIGTLRSTGNYGFILDTNTGNVSNDSAQPAPASAVRFAPDGTGRETYERFGSPYDAEYVAVGNTIHWTKRGSSGLAFASRADSDISSAPTDGRPVPLEPGRQISFCGANAELAAYTVLENEGATLKHYTIKAGQVDPVARASQAANAVGPGYTSPCALSSANMWVIMSDGTIGRIAL